MATKRLTELPAVPVSAWRVRSLASEDHSSPTEQLIGRESDSAAIIGSSSNPLVPYSAHIPARFPPPEIQLTNESSEIKSKPSEYLIATTAFQGCHGNMYHPLNTKMELTLTVLYSLFWLICKVT